MDGITSLLARARKAGVLVEVDGDNLRIEGGPDNRSLAAELLRRKAEILPHLAGEPPVDELPQATPRMAPVMRCFADVEAEPVRWLWPGRIAIGKLTLVSGDPGLGKSFLTVDLAARVSMGTNWPDGTPAPRGSVIFLNAEDDAADTIRPRLDAAGADVAKVWTLDATARRDEEGEYERGVDLAADLDVLEAAFLRAPDCRLLIVDPISAYCGRTDSHKNAEVRSLLRPLGDLAAKHNVAIVAISHLRKGDGAAIYRSMGSMAFTAAARAAFAVCRDPDDDGRRLFLPVKNNLGDDSGGLGYRLIGEGTTPAVVWDAEPETRTADDIMTEASARRSAGNQGAEADALLQELLADGGKPSREILEAAREHGISEKGMRKAYADAGGKPRKAGMNRGWIWDWPANWITPAEASWGVAAEDAAEDARDRETAIFGKTPCFSEDSRKQSANGHLRETAATNATPAGIFESLKAWNEHPSAATDADDLRPTSSSNATLKAPGWTVVEVEADQ